MPTTFEGIPIIGWAVDSVEELKQIVDTQNGAGSFDRYLTQYVNYSMDAINSLFTKGAYSLNFGGNKEKIKLITTDKPNGVFNFSLASPSLYRLQEYYSEELANEQPNKFKEYNTVSGIVPPDLVRRVNMNGVDTYIYTDPLIQKDYYCKKQQRGTQEIEDKVPNARLEFASKTKKVYQTYKRKGGKVKYVEIYSLTYFSSLDGDVQYAVRHLPAYMLAEYLESVGIKTRVYITRFVKIPNQFSGQNYVKLKDSYNGFPLPMAQTTLGRNFNYCLVVQPIIAKDFQQEIDRSLYFAIGSRSKTQFVDSCVENAYDKELINSIEVRGKPDWRRNDYWEGIERYRNKYEQYVKLGFFQSKEVLPEAMVFIHDMSIKEHFDTFCQTLRTIFNQTRDEINLTNLEVNQFFVWWMKLSGNRIKHKINIMNATNFRKDVDEIRKDLEDSKDELDTILNGTTNQELKQLFTQTSVDIFDNFRITQGANSLFLYIQEITIEVEYFATGEFYGTPQERKQQIGANVIRILTEVKKVIN